MEKYYVNQYPVGWEISQSISLERWPISHGPFASSAEAEKWAVENLVENVEEEEMQEHLDFQNMTLDQVLEYGQKVYRFPARAKGTILWCTDGHGYHTGYYIFPTELVPQILAWSREPEEYCLQYFEVP